MPYSPTVHAPTSTSVTRRAHAESLRVAPPSGQWRLLSCHANAGCALEVTVHRSHHGLAPKDRGLPSVQYSSTARGPTTTCAARRARAASLPIPPPPEIQPAQWRLFACHVNAGCALEVTARRSHQGLAPKERGLPPVQCSPTVRGPTTISEARREGAESLRVSSPPGQWRFRVPRECRLHVGGHSSHVVPRSCTGRERPPAGAAPFQYA